MGVELMVYLEEHRLAREATTDEWSEYGYARCVTCGADVPIRVPETTDATRKVGYCRCTCGLVWEVQLDSAA
jgi:hypothetical protein